MTSPAPVPPGTRILVVEDDYFIAEGLRRAFRKAGADVVGPAPTVRQALDLLADTPDLAAAVLDINLDGDGPVFPVADALQARHVPFAFTTGYDSAAIPEAYAHVKRFEKPCNAMRVLQALIAP